MSRHRIVRSMNYEDECDYEDVYGHSVEDDSCISPSVAAQFMYDRGRMHEMSAYFNSAGDIPEEEEQDSSAADVTQTRTRLDSASASHQRARLSQTDEVRLQSCLDEIHNVVGDCVPEYILVDNIIKHDFDLEKSLNAILTSSSKDLAPTAADAPKPQRERRMRCTNKGLQKSLGDYSDVAALQVATNGEVETEFTGVGSDTGPPIRGKSQPPSVQLPVKVVPAAVNAPHIVTGFDIPSAESLLSGAGEGLKLAKKDGTTLEPQAESSVIESESKGKPRKDTSSPQDNSSVDETLSSLKIETETVTPHTSRAQSPASEVKTPIKTKGSKMDAIEAYNKERSGSKDLLNLVVVGHVDAGKSTLMGHLLYSLGQVNKKTMHKYEMESKKIGKQSFMYAWVLDETGEERSRGITMDVGQTKFETASKIITLLDAPGHKDFIPNMITGASQADVAVLVVDATRGEFETGFESGGQTREHALLIRSLGVTQLVVVVNKMDTVGWCQNRFNEISKKLRQFLKQVGFREADVTFIPCSGLTGENLTQEPSETELRKWYTGTYLLEVIDKFQAPTRPVSKPFRLSISDVYKGTGSGFWVSGRVETGMVQTGDKVLVLPQNEAVTIKCISIDEQTVQTAFAGDYTNLSVSGMVMQNICVGYIMCDPTQTIKVTTHIQARIVIFNIEVPITKGFPVILHYQSLSEPAVIKRLISQLHKSTGEVIKKKPRCLTKNSNAVIELEIGRPVCMELYRDVKELGRFMLRTGGVTIAAGLVTEIY